MKKAGKFILYTFLTFFLFIVLLIIVAALAENKIAKFTVEQIGKTINVPVKLDEIEFSLVHDFPYATIQCRNLLVSSPSASEIGKPDTLAFVSQLYVAVQTRKLIKGIFEIRKIDISDAKMYYTVDSAGVSNLDFLNDTTRQNGIDTSANSFFLDIKEFRIENTLCYYSDKKLNASADLQIEQLDLSGLINNEQHSGEAEGKVVLTNCAYDTTNLYLMKKTDIDFLLKYDAGFLTLEHATIFIDDDINLALNGTVNLGESISTEMNVKAEKLDLGSLTKYVPESYFQEYGIRNFSGILAAEAAISGVISDSIIPAVNIEFNFTQGNVQYQDYPALRRISLRGSATNGKQQNNSTTSINIRSLNFQTAKSKAAISGKVENLDQLKYNLSSTLDINLEEVANFVPDSVLKSISGNVKAVISTNGTLPDSISNEYIDDVLAKTKANLQFTDVNTEIDSLLSVSRINTTIEYQANQILVNNFRAGIHYDTIDVDSINLEAKIIGNLLKYDSLDIQFSQFEAAFKNNNVALTGHIKNPLNPYYSVRGKLNLNLAEFKNFIPDSLVSSLSGSVSTTIESEAELNLDSISNQMNALLFEHSKFQVTFYNISAEMADSSLSVQNFSGQLKYPTDSLWIDQMQGNYHGIHFAMNSVTAANIYSAAYLNQETELAVQGNFVVGDIDYTEIEKLLVSDTTENDQSESKPINFTYKINGRFKANSLKFEDAFFKNIESKFLVKENYYVFDSLKLDAFDGQSLSSAKIEMKPNDELTLFFKTDIKKMDASKLIKSFYQYIDYEDIKAENVQGIFSTKMNGEIVLKNYEPVYESLMLKGDFTIENGALFNVKPVVEIEKINGVGLRNMDSLYFSTLSSNIFLFKNDLYFPRTEIRSTSFDAMFLGMYSFGEDYAYHIRMFLGEVLSSKSKANLRKQARDDGFEEEDENDVTKGRTSIYVVSKSEDGKEKAGFDKKKDRQNMVAKVNLQKQMVDMSFHPALVKYETDE